MQDKEKSLHLEYRDYLTASNINLGTFLVVYNGFSFLVSQKWCGYGAYTCMGYLFFVFVCKYDLKSTFLIIFLFLSKNDISDRFDRIPICESWRLCFGRSDKILIQQSVRLMFLRQFVFCDASNGKKENGEFQSKLISDAVLKGPKPKDAQLYEI